MLYTRRDRVRGWLWIAFWEIMSQREISHTWKMHVTYIYRYIHVSTGSNPHVYFNVSTCAFHYTCIFHMRISLHMYIRVYITAHRVYITTRMSLHMYMSHAYIHTRISLHMYINLHVYFNVSTCVLRYTYTDVYFTSLLARVGRCISL